MVRGNGFHRFTLGLNQFFTPKHQCYQVIPARQQTLHPIQSTFNAQHDIGFSSEIVLSEVLLAFFSTLHQKSTQLHSLI